MVNRMIAPQNIHILTLEICEYVMLNRKRVFADMIREDGPGSSGWNSLFTSVLKMDEGMGK